MSGSAENLTAWAGVGNGVLFFDPTSQGILTHSNQIVFTDWDPGATSDMQALKDVFDTNHDGSLDAGDADFNDFFVEVTNANGTKTAYSLAQLGITSINLTANTTQVALPDGSLIDGETTYTTSSGGTGTAATVTFAYDTDGYASLDVVKTANADGSETITRTALNADGSFGEEIFLNTSASGLSDTLTTLTLGGIAIQTNVTSGSTNTVTNYLGGVFSTTTAELTGAGVSGAEKLNSTVTTTSTTGSGATQVAILRDQLGGGWTTQEEVQTKNTDGSTSDVISDLNFDGSTSNVTTNTVSANGLTSTTTSLVDGQAADSTTSVDQITVSGSTETETVTDSAGTTVTGLTQTVTQTATNSVTHTTTSDLTNGTTAQLVTVSQTVTGSTGSTTTLTESGESGVLLGETVTTNTVQSSGGQLTAVTSHEFDGYGNFIETGSATTTTSNAGAVTVVDDSANGTLRSEVINTNTINSGAGGSITTYGNGDGAITQLETITAGGGTTTETVENFNGNGSLVNEVVAATTGGGLSKTTSVDSTGAGSASAPVFDHITTDVAAISGENITDIITDYGAAVTSSDEIDETERVLSANGLTETTLSAFTAASLAAGTWDQIATDQTTVNANGSLTETITTTDGNNNVLETITKATSADRRTLTTTTTLGTTGLVKTVETGTTANNGSVTDQVVNFDQQGDVTGATVTTTSADGLVQTVQQDILGQTAAAYAASGLSFCMTTTTTTVINPDGSRTQTTNVTAPDGLLLSTASVTASANGLVVTTIDNPYATAQYATETVSSHGINANDGNIYNVAEYAYDGVLIEKTTNAANAPGTLKTVNYDFNGDGIIDQSANDVITVNADGSRTETVTDYTGAIGTTVRGIITTTSGIIVAGAGLETEITRQSNGSVGTYQVETIMPSANGTVTDTTKYYAQAGGPLLLETIDTTSANGLVKTIGTAVNGDTSTDFYTSDSIVLSANGSQTETVAHYNRAGLISETVTTTSANGLTTTTATDANGQFFNLTTTATTLRDANGSGEQVTVSTAANGAEIEETDAITSADQQTVAIYRYLDETGTISNIDQSVHTQTAANGTVTSGTYTWNAQHNFMGVVVTTTSANGLVKSTQYENSNETVVDSQTDTITYDANGDGGTIETFTDSDGVVSGATYTTSRTKQVSGNDQTTVITLALAAFLGSTKVAGFTDVADTSIAIATTGVTTQTTTDTINGASTTADTTTAVTSANGMTTTISTALGNANPFIVQQSSTALDGSQSQVTTYYDPDSLTLILDQVTIGTSWDGRTVTTTTMSDFDGTHYNTETDTSVENANGTTTETRSGTGSFNAPAYSQVVNTVTNADSSITTTTQNFDALGSPMDQMVADTSPDGLIKTYAYDTDGEETLANLDAAADNIFTGTFPSSLLGTDILAYDYTALNTDGSKIEIDESFYGALASVRSETTTLTSANGLVTTTFVMNNGDGVYDQVITSTVNPDGSLIRVTDNYSYASGVTLVDGAYYVGSTLSGSTTYTESANGLVTTLVNSTGVTDTTVDFANSNGSYEFSQAVIAGSNAASSGVVNGTASHFIDVNGIDTWSWNNGAGSSGTIEIAVATETQDIAFANEIYQTLLGRQMSEAETQYLAQYIVNGQFSPATLATNVINSSQYAGDYAGSTAAYFSVFAAFENALGRSPTAEELATFARYFPIGGHDSTPYLAPAVLAIAQYAMDQQSAAATALSDPIFDEYLLNSPAPPTTHATLTASGTYDYSNYMLTDGVSAVISGNNAVINGNNDMIAFRSGHLALSGYNNFVDINQPGETDPAVAISASNTSILIQSGAIVSITGNNDQISEIVGTSDVGVSGTDDVISIAASAVPLTEIPPYTGNSITYASNATVSVQAGVVGQSISGNDDTISIGAGSYVYASGSGNIVYLTGNGGGINTASTIIYVDAGVAAGGNVASGNIVMEAGSSLNLTGNGSAIDLLSDASLYATGNGLGIYVGAGSFANLAGTGDTVDETGYGANVSITSGTLTINAGVSGSAYALNSTVDVDAGSVVNMSGNGDNISVSTNGVLVDSGNSNIVSLGSGAQAALSSGSGDQVTATTGSGTAVALTNGSLTVDNGVSAAAIANTSTITLGDGATIGMAGSGDTVIGGGNDNYSFDPGFGQITVENSAAANNGAASGTLGFAGTGSEEQLWFVQSGNNLKIDLLGTSDSITVSNWYAGASNQVVSIGADDGLKIDTQLQQLVSAMATYQTNNPSFNPTQATTMPTDPTLQTAIAAAWHH